MSLIILARSMDETGNWIMGGDKRIVTSDGFIMSDNYTKVRKLVTNNETLLIGLTGSLGCIDRILRWIDWLSGQTNFKNIDNIEERIIHELKKASMDSGDNMHGHALIVSKDGYPREISLHEKWELEFKPSESCSIYNADNVYAIGRGDEMAIGIMYSTLYHQSDVERTMADAFRTVSKLISSVSENIDIISTKVE